jgi:hypothetical protein
MTRSPWAALLALPLFAACEPAQYPESPPASSAEPPQTELGDGVGDVLLAQGSRQTACADGTPPPCDAPASCAAHPGNAACAGSPLDPNSPTSPNNPANPASPLNPMNPMNPSSPLHPAMGPKP